MRKTADIMFMVSAVLWYAMKVTSIDSNRNVYRELERLRKKGLLIKLESLKTGNIYGFRDSETLIPEDNYSPEVLNLLHELKNSRSSEVASCLTFSSISCFFLAVSSSHCCCSL